MKNKIYLAAWMLSAALLLNGCAKDGPTGPQGPPGNANVQAVDYTVTNLNWIVSNNSTYWYTQFQVPEITATVTDAGTVNVFFSVDGGNTWRALPFTQPNAPDYNYFMDFLQQDGLIEVDWTYDTNPASLGDNPNHYYATNAGDIVSRFKVVVIPPAMKKPNVDTRNYNAVKAAYNLKD